MDNTSPSPVHSSVPNADNKTPEPVEFDWWWIIVIIFVILFLFAGVFLILRKSSSSSSVMTNNNANAIKNIRLNKVR